MDWWLKCIKNYVNFNGRARRKEYWMFTLFNFIFSNVLYILESVIGLQYDVIIELELIEYKIGILSGLYLLFILLPSLAVAVRRLHDTGKSGFYILVNFIPLAGFIWYLVLMCTDGHHFENQYGPDPKAQAELDTSYINS